MLEKHNLEGALCYTSLAHCSYRADRRVTDPSF